MIWNLIRDFFVQYIFGGVDSELNAYGGIIQGYEGDTVDTSQLSFSFNNIFVDSEYPYYISMGDWLSTTATIITMIAFIIGLIALAVWLFKLVGNLIMLRH